MYTRCKFRPRPGSVARGLGVQSLAIWQVITGSRSAEPEPCRTMEIPHFIITSLQLVYGQPRYNTRFKLSPLLHRRTLLTRVDTTYACGHYTCVCAACACVRARVCACVLALGKASFGTVFFVGIDT